MNGGKRALYAAAASSAIPAAVMAAFVSGWYTALFAVLAAAAFLFRLYMFSSTATVLSLSALLLFIYLQPPGLQTDAVGALLIPVIALFGSLPGGGDAEVHSGQGNGGTAPFLVYQLAGLFLVSTASVIVTEILSSQIGFSINSLVLIIPVIGAAMVLIIFAAEGIRDGNR
jgi:hypothetical protein